MRDAGVADGEARRLASGALLQQVAQVSGLVSLLAIVTLLARRLGVAELGAYGLVASLAGYLLVFRNSVAASAVRAMAAADGAERARMFSTAAALYAAVGLATGVLLALVGLVLAGTILEGELATEARLGALVLGAVTALGLTASVHLDALRAERVFVRAASVEICGVLAHLGVMLVLILGGARLGVVIGFSGGMPLMSGTLSAIVVRRTLAGLRLERAAVTRDRMAAIVPTAGYLLLAELSNLVIYALDRVILGAFGSARTVGLYEGPVRAHNLLYALGGALSVPTVPTASRYLADRDAQRLHGLAVRGSRYTLALFVPLCVTLMTLAQPLLEVWLGERYAGGGTALAILVSYWRARRHAGLPRRRGPRSRAGPGADGGGRGQPRAVAGAHAVARPRGPGARHRDPLRAGVPGAAATGAPRVGRDAPGAGEARLGAGVLAGRGPRDRASGTARGRRRGRAGGGRRRRDRRRPRLLGRVLRALAGRGRARAAARAHPA